MNVYYVSTTGNDSNSGLTPDRPFLTIGHAAAVIGSGDIVLVADGTYTLTSTNISITASGIDESYRTTFLSANKGGAKIINNITPTNSDITDPAFFINANFVDVTGFDISGVNGRVGVMGFGVNNTGSGNPAGSYMRVRSTYIHDLGTAVSQALNVAGIQFNQFRTTPGYNAIYNEASSNIVRNVGQIGNTASHGIYFGTAYGTAFNNIVSGVPGFGLRAFHFPHHMLFSNNLIFNCGSNAPVGGDGLVAGGGIFLSAGGTGWIQGTDEPCDFCVVANNIIRDCIGYGGIYEYGGSQPANLIPQVVANNTFLNNCFYGNVGSVANPVRLDSGAANQNAVNANPLFVNYQLDGSGDYHLQAKSPCIDSGVGVGCLSDYDGNKRPSGYGYDIGPYEVKQISFHG